MNAKFQTSWLVALAGLSIFVRNLYGCFWTETGCLADCFGHLVDRYA